MRYQRKARRTMCSRHPSVGCHFFTAPGASRQLGTTGENTSASALAPNVLKQTKRNADPEDPNDTPTDHSSMLIVWKISGTLLQRMQKTTQITKQNCINILAILVRSRTLIDGELRKLNFRAHTRGTMCSLLAHPVVPLLHRARRRAAN